MNKHYIVRHDKNVGTVIFILEGSKTEFQLLNKIFVDLLGYQIHELRRTKAQGFELRGSNPYSRIVALNLKSNFLFGINQDELDQLFVLIAQELKIKPEDVPIYYLYDRDVKSYEIDEVREYVERYQDPYGTIEGDQGQLLLSYPSIESYMVSCFQEDAFTLEYELGKALKQDAAQNGHTIQMIKKNSQIIHAADELNRAIEHHGIDEYDLDRLGDVLLSLYNHQQDEYLEKNTFRLLSTLSFAFLELGIIEETDCSGE